MGAAEEAEASLRAQCDSLRCLRERFFSGSAENITTMALRGAVIVRLLGAYIPPAIEQRDEEGSVLVAAQPAVIDAEGVQEANRLSSDLLQVFGKPEFVREATPQMVKTAAGQVYKGKMSRVAGVMPIAGRNYYERTHAFYQIDDAWGRPGNTVGLRENC
ncbi:unnamed protein product [Amoebophrya sp. A25]|nr:unnamed protein product [Amoebophrya sp. A25]|eukprot:GSA25T00002869001.1